MNYSKAILSRNSFLLRSLIILLGIPGICAPSLTTASPTPLAQAIELAKAKSPDIQSLQQQLESIEAKARQAFSPSEPSFSLIYNDMSQPLNPSLTTSTVMQITQPLGFPGKALLSHSALSEQAQSVAAQLRAARLQVATTIKTSYFQLGLAQENLKINEELRASLETIQAIAQRRYETGSITQVDYLNAEVALGSNANDLTDLRVNERVARAQLNVYLKNPATFPFEVEPLLGIKLPTLGKGGPEGQGPDQDQGLKQMLTQRPEIQAAEHAVNAANRTTQLAWMSLLPDFSLSVGSTIYNLPGASPLSSLPNAPTHTYLASIQMTLPIWFLLNEREAIVGATHDRATAEANLDSLLNQSKIAYETAIAGLEASHLKIENYEKHLVPRSEQALSAALVSYSTGKIDYLTLAETARARRNIRKDYFTLIVNYLIGFASYGQLIGEEL